jgi:hypothetical protein
VLKGVRPACQRGRSDSTLQVRGHEVVRGAAAAVGISGMKSCARDREQRLWAGLVTFDAVGGCAQQALADGAGGAANLGPGCDPERGGQRG